MILLILDENENYSSIEFKIVLIVNGNCDIGRASIGFEEKTP